MITDDEEFHKNNCARCGRMYTKMGEPHCSVEPHAYLFSRQRNLADWLVNKIGGVCPELKLSSFAKQYVQKKAELFVKKDMIDFVKYVIKQIDDSPYSDKGPEDHYNDWLKVKGE